LYLSSKVPAGSDKTPLPPGSAVPGALRPP
jgi:hypothetical protein